MRTNAHHFVSVEGPLYLASDRYCSIPEYQMYVCLVFDKIKEKENLLYNKHSASLMGFVKIGGMNDHFSKFNQNASSVTFKPNLATHIHGFGHR